MHEIVVSDTAAIMFRIVTMICTIIVTYWLIPLIKSKMGSERIAEAYKVAEIGVKAAEQIFTEPGSGALKKDDVCQFLSEWLSDHNIKMTADQIDKVIESAVYVMKQDEVKNE